MSEPRKPNLVFVLVDQMRYHAMGCAGNPDVRTPNLDRMSAEGACFDRAVSISPVCTPARACLLTGRYPLGHTTLTNNSMLPNDMPSMGKMLKAAGYDTGYIGKWHLAGEAYIGKTAQNGGQEGWIPPGELRHGWDYWAVHNCTHAYQNAHYYRDTPEPISAGPWEPDHQTDLAIHFLRERAEAEAAKPFALVVSWGTPHTPFIAPPEFRDLYDAASLELRRNVELPLGLERCEYRPPRNAGLPPEQALRDLLAHYYGAVSNIDHNLGRLLQELDRLGLGDDTLVVFTSDHGEMMGSHGQMHKGIPYDESILVPFLLRWPGRIAPGTRVARPFGEPDVLPTLFALLGLSVPSPVEGFDFSPALRGEPVAAPESTLLIWTCNAVTWGKKWTSCNDYLRLYNDLRREYRGIRTETHTYVRDRNGPWLLFDNVADPYQFNNLIETRGAVAVPPELDRELGAWLERTRDPFESTQYYVDRIDLETGLATRPEEFTR